MDDSRDGDDVMCDRCISLAACYLIGIHTGGDAENDMICTDRPRIKDPHMPNVRIYETVDTNR